MDEVERCGLLGTHTGCEEENKGLQGVDTVFVVDSSVSRCLEVSGMSSGFMIK